MKTLHLLLLCLALDAAAAPLYTYRHLGTVEGRSFSPVAFTENGWILGQTGGGRTFLRRPDGEFELISDRPNDALDVNSMGVVVGAFFSPRPLGSGFVRAPGERPTDFDMRVAWGINDAGQIAGERDFQAVLFSPGSGITELGILPGGTRSGGMAINHSGQVAGWSWTGEGTHAFLYTAGTGMLDLGVAPGFDSSFAYDLNDLGHVVGYMGTCCNPHAFIWTPEAGMIDIGTIGTSSHAYSIDNRGWVVGQLSLATTVGSTAFLYRPGFGTSLLSDFVKDFDGVLSSAVGINERGEIIATGVVDGIPRGFLLTPVPEPTQVTLLALGLMAIVVMRLIAHRDHGTFSDPLRDR